MESKRTSMEYCHKKLELQYKSVSVHLQVCMVGKEHHNCLLFTDVRAKLFCIVVCAVPTLLELRVLAAETQV